MMQHENVCALVHANNVMVKYYIIANQQNSKGNKWEMNWEQQQQQQKQ